MAVPGRLQEGCGNNALPYRTIAQWVKAFCAGRKKVADSARGGGPSVIEKQMELVRGLLYTDRHWTVKELTVEVGLSLNCVVHH